MEPWPPQHQTIETARNWLRDLPQEKERTPLTNAADFFCYVQWIAHQQWRDVKAYAEATRRRADGRHSIWRQLLQR